MSTALAAAFRRHVAGDRAGAVPYYEAGLRHHPDAFEAWMSYAELLSQQEQHAGAIECARRAVDLAPRHINANKNLGTILCRAEDYPEALIYLDKAYALSVQEGAAAPSWSIALDRAILNYKTGNLELSEQLFGAAIAYAPSDQIRAILCTHMASPVLAQAVTKDQVGGSKWIHGLGLYRHRFQELARTQAWELGAPEWEGQDLAGKHLLIHQDQGDGDTIQFCRWLPGLARTAAKLTLAVPDHLINLLYNLPWHTCRKPFEVLDLYGDLPVPDFHSPIGSYMQHCARDAGAELVPYLRPQGYCAWLRTKAEPGLSVGIVWAPRLMGEAARRRVVPLEQLLPLGRTPGIQLYSLQINKAAHDLERAVGLVDDLAPKLRDWADTAAYMAELDLIISTDTATLHLAGALGKPCIGLLPFAPCWRWGRGIDSSPFYPSMTLLRQEHPGDWSGPIHQASLIVANKLEARRLAA